MGLRPFLGPASCKFSPSCGQYTIRTLQSEPLLRACVLICKRVWYCSPWG